MCSSDLGISNVTQGGQTAGTSGMVNGDNIRFVFVPGSNITMSQSIDAGGSSGMVAWQFFIALIRAKKLSVIKCVTPAIMSSV